jgi:hypothetical protein
MMATRYFDEEGLGLIAVLIPTMPYVVPIASDVTSTQPGGIFRGNGLEGFSSGFLLDSLLMDSPFRVRPADYTPARRRTVTGL